MSCRVLTQVGSRLVERGVGCPGGVLAGVHNHARKLWHEFRSSGPQHTAKLAATWMSQHLLRVSPDFVQHRYLLSERVCRDFDYTVQGGPFLGLKLDPASYWSAADRGAMVLGQYEKQVLAELSRLASPDGLLVDVGAGDGYYAVGALRGGLVSSTVCFEMSEQGRAAIRSNAETNGIASGDLTILGTATPTFLDDLPPTAWELSSKVVLLMDVEGAEFDLLSRENLERMRDFSLIVELHEPRHHQPSRVDDLVARTQGIFSTRIIETGSRNPSQIDYLSNWCDDDRWLLMSESRAYAMRWLVMEPRTHTSPTNLSSE